MKGKIDLAKQFEPTKEQRFAALESAEKDAEELERQAKQLGRTEPTWVVAKFYCKTCAKNHFYGGDILGVWKVEREKLCKKRGKRVTLTRVYESTKRESWSYNEYPN